MKLENKRKIILYVFALIMISLVIYKFYIADIRNRFIQIQREIKLSEAILKKNLEIQKFRYFKKFEKLSIHVARVFSCIYSLSGFFWRF